MNLGGFFGERTIGELTGTLQRDYAKQRGSQSAARRELETLAAAVNYHIRDMVGGVQTLFRPVLPDARRGPRALANPGGSGPADLGGMAQAATHEGGKEAGRYTSKHIARFILVALYTGTRAGAICGASLIPTIGRGYVNPETGQFRRLAYGKKETDNKKQPTVELPLKLLAHIRRWHRLGISTRAVVEFDGKPVLRVNKGWPTVVKAAGLATDIKELRVIPHTLRHTSISWYLGDGVPIKT